MTPKDVVTRIAEHRVDGRVLRHAVRLRSLVTIINEKQEPVMDYPQALSARNLYFTLTRRGKELAS